MVLYRDAVYLKETVVLKVTVYKIIVRLCLITCGRYFFSDFHENSQYIIMLKPSHPQNITRITEQICAHILERDKTYSNINKILNVHMARTSH